MSWITQEEFQQHIDEYGEHSYETLVVEVLEEDNCDAYIDIINNHKHLTDEIGRVLIVPPLPSS